MKHSGNGRWRLLRKRRGLSLRETARRARIDPAHLSRIERGQAGIGLEALLRLSRALGADEVIKAMAPFTSRHG